MIEFLEILKYTLPSIIVLLSAVFVLKAVLTSEVKKRQHEAGLKMSTETLQLRLQAYERIVLLLERISPQQMLFRLEPGEMEASPYQGVLLKSIREEFEHNLTQQIYVSTEAWSWVKSARESVVVMINQAMGGMKNDASALDLATKLLEINMMDGNKQIDAAITFVKKEVNELF